MNSDVATGRKMKGREGFIYLPILSWGHHTLSLSLANFVDCVVGFLNVCIIRLRSLLLAAALSFDRIRNQRARNKN